MPRSLFKLSLCLSLILSLFFVTPSVGRGQQEASQDYNQQSYPKSYFEQYAPQNARDMIDRLPGFSLDVGEQLRGFGSAAGNVLINGVRPSSKEGGVEEALERISAKSVERIDVIRGSAGVSETAGQSIVANVIITESQRTTRWEVQVERAHHAKINTAIEAVFARRFGGWNSSTKISGSIERQPLGGSRVTRDALDRVVFVEREYSPSNARRIGVSTEASKEMGDGIFTFNANYIHAPGDRDTSRFAFDTEDFVGDPTQLQQIDFTRSRDIGEVGFDWNRPFARGWSLKLLSLSSYRDEETESLVFLERPFGILSSESDFDRSQRLFETVARGIVSRGGEHGLKPEFGGEFAYNRLNSRFALQVEDMDGPRNIALPAANVLVEEIRGELFANLIWSVNKKFSVESGIAAEASEISVSGDADNRQSFFFVKPFVTLIYDVRSAIQLRLGARHTVGQLDFSDFAASASAADDRLTAGNPELGPDQTTRLSSSVDLRSDIYGALNFELFHEWRSDILEQIILPLGGQGIGNAGSARVWGLKASASVPLNIIIPGGLLEVEAELRESKFNDPIISRARSVSSIDEADIFVEFRQDILKHRVAWGVSYRAPLQGPFFFTDEISRARDGRQWSAFVETTRFFGVKTTLAFEGIGNRNFSRERLFFSPDRGGEFTGSQVISRNTGLSINLNVTGQF